MNYLKWGIGIGIFVIGIAIVIWGAVTQWKFIPNKNSGSSPGPSPGSAKVKNVIWHVNSKMGSVSKFPWDPNYKMKGMIENFIVGIWPTWHNNLEIKALATSQTATGGIMDAGSLIKLAKNYAQSINANFVPYLLPAISGWDKKISTAEDLLDGIDGQFGILKELFNVECKGVLIEQEEHYMSKDNMPNVNVNIMATQLFAAMKSPWVKTKKLKYIPKDFKIAWSEQGPMPPQSIQGYDSANSKISNLGKPLDSTPDFTWPDSYEANWVGGWGHWNVPLLKSCKSGTKTWIRRMSSYRNGS